MKRLALVLIVLVNAPRAGKIFTPVCSRCGYEGVEVRAGNGPGPGSGREARQAFQAAHEPSLGRFLGAWHPPEETGLTVGAGSFLRDGALPGGRLHLVGDPWNGLHPCPACGKRTLEFVVTGEWD